MSHDKHHHDSATHASRRLHRDWRVWGLVILMLAAIAMYVITLDDSTVPHFIPK